MYKSAKSRAEEKFALTQKKHKQAQKEKEKARQERADLVSKLRALRLAKEASDKGAEEKSAAKGKKPTRSPKVPMHQS